MTEHSARIPALDGLRAISITLVIISHLMFTKNFIVPVGIIPSWLTSLGELGVRIFFVISGFLITTILLQELEAKGTIYLAKFYFRRTLRIFLPYYFFVLIIISLQAIGSVKLTQGDILHAITYTINYYPERSWEVTHAWSLSVEEQFYLLWPAVLLMAGKHYGLYIASFVIAICPMIRLGIWYFFPTLLPYEVGYRFETVADSIAAGCLLAGSQKWLKLRSVYRNVLGSRLFIVVPVIIFYVCLLPGGSRYNLLLGITIQNIGIAACIAWCITHYRGKIGRILNSRPVGFLGRMSYSVYLWQQLFLNRHSSSVVTSFPLNLVLVTVTSLASYYLIEGPSLELRHRLEKRIFAHRRGDQVSDNVPLPAVGDATPTDAQGNIMSVDASSAAEVVPPEGPPTTSALSEAAPAPTPTSPLLATMGPNGASRAPGPV
jgi:peptidoglycan/LPS O-acetylase OafA/YrhL